LNGRLVTGFERGLLEVDGDVVLRRELSDSLGWY
jgi:hypothetical protein